MIETHQKNSRRLDQSFRSHFQCLKILALLRKDAQWSDCMQRSKLWNVCLQIFDALTASGRFVFVRFAK